MNFVQKLSPAVYYGELILPILFITESHYSLHHLPGGVTIDRGESFFNNFEGLLLLPLKEHQSNKSTMHVEHCSPRTLLKCIKYGLPKVLFFDSLLSLITESLFSGI
jgi:hypothetical protein